MGRTRVWLAAGALLLVALPGTGHACSPAPLGLHEQFGRHAQVFLGTVRHRVREAAPGQAVYRIFVDEAFKGLPDKGRWPGELEVTLSESEQCGLGRAAKNARILVFMNEGDVVNQTSGSRLVWREAEQKEAHLNPVMDDLVTLRRLLLPTNPAGVVPDEDAALHQALKILLPVLGRAEVARQMPFQATYLADAPDPDGRVWRVEAAPECRSRKPDPCREGGHVVEVNRWSGDVVRVHARGRP
jgi:hypothetical protein